MQQLNIRNMSIDEVRSTFENMLAVLYWNIENLTIENKLIRLKNAMGGNVYFRAEGGYETPELELDCLEYTYIMSKLDPP